MSSLGSPNPFFIAGKKAYEVERSLRFNDDDSTYLQFTPSSTGNRKTWTWSSWVKRSNISLGAQATIFHSYGSGNQRTELIFETNDTLTFAQGTASENGEVTTTAVFRDISAWYHIVCVADFSNGTAGNRFKLYVNGVEQANTINTAFTDADGQMPTSSVPIEIGGRTSNRFFDGYLAEINFIDGTALTPSSFAKTDALTGQWIPKKYGGSYGTNGFYLNFSDNSGTTATTLGKDSSGNGHNFTPNNFSVSAGTGNDSLEDSPTNNFATLNGLKKPTNGTFSNGNLDGSGNASNWVSFFSTILVSSGKWFCEVKVNATRVGVGIAKDGANENSYLGSAADTYAYYDLNGKWNNGSNTSYGATYTTNDIIGIALDMDAGTLIFYKNGASQGTAFTGLSGEFALGFSVYGGSANASINYGQRAFDYTVPTGYKALNSANLPDPTIKLPNKHFGTLLYTGQDTSSLYNVTGLEFQPDLVWGKARNDTIGNIVFDAVRGEDKQLETDISDAEVVRGSAAYRFLSNGFAVSTVGNLNNPVNYVAWNWNAGGSTASNSDGSITSSVRANTTAGFSIVTYTGTGSNATVGHGLGVKPDCILLKRRDAGSDWMVFHQSLGSTKNQRLSYALSTYTQSTIWNDTDPTSSAVNIGTSSAVNADGSTYLMYCFSEVAGYSKFGSYKGNGNSNGPFVFTGFRPAFVIFKYENGTTQWNTRDIARDTYNPTEKYLLPSDSGAEGTSSHKIDFLSNGFKHRGTGAAFNSSGGTYIYLAFAESPFKYSRAR